MNKIMRAFGAVVAMCSMNVSSAPAAGREAAVSEMTERDEVVMARLMRSVKPTFAIDFSDLTDQSFKGT